MRISQGLPTSAGEGVAIQDGNGGTEVAPRAEALAPWDLSSPGSVTTTTAPSTRRWPSPKPRESSRSDGASGTHREPRLRRTCGGRLAVLPRTRCTATQRRGHVLQDINAADPANPLTSLDVVRSWPQSLPSQTLRARVAKAAVDREWFKDVPGGRELGKSDRRSLPDPQLATTVAMLEQIRSFVYPGRIAAKAARAAEAGEEDRRGSAWMTHSAQRRLGYSRQRRLGRDASR